MELTKLYDLCPFFFMRRPVFSFSLFEQVTSDSYISEKIIEIYNNSAQIRKAITVASPSLSVLLDQYHSLKKQKQKRNLLETLYSYLVRMSTRSTPFGLFSAVSLGTWGKNTHIHFDHKDLKNTFYPDAEWLWKLRLLLQSNEKLLSKLAIKKNSFLIENAAQLFLSHRINSKKNSSNLILKKTALLDKLITLCPKFISVTEIYHKLQLEFSNLDQTKFYKFLTQLLEEEIIVSDFPDSLNDSKPLSSILSFIEHHKFEDPLKEQLLNIQNRMLKISESPIYQGAEEIIELNQLMQSLMKTPNSTYSTLISPKCLTLPKEIKDQITLGLNLLYNIFQPTKPHSHLKKYHSNFLNTYGVSIAVPFLEVIDECWGIGLPKREESSMSTPANYSSHFMGWLKDQCFQAIANQKAEVVLKDSDLQHFISKKEHRKTPPSLDIYCELYSPNQELLNTSDYFLIFYPISGVFMGCSAASRFITDLNAKGFVDEFTKQEEALQSDSLFIESFYWPSKIRAANVCRRPNTRKKKIDSNRLSNTETVSFEDIYIIASDQSLHLCDSTGNPLHISNTSALNQDLIPEKNRLLHEISSHSYETIDTHLWDLKSSFPYLPRIRYQNIVFSPAQWCLDRGSVKHIIDSLLEITSFIKSWIEEYRIPKYVRMSDGGDKKLLLNLDHKPSFDLLIKTLQKKTTEKLYFTELPYRNLNQAPTENLFFSEFIFPAVKSKKYSNPAVQPPIFYKRSSALTRTCKSNQWLSYLIYLPIQNEKRCLVDYLSPFLNQNRANIEKWFFIRYSDHIGTHFRLRFKIFANQEANFVHKLQDWMSHLHAHKIIIKYSSEQYVQEFERYGGHSMMPYTESIFCADSRLVLKLIEFGFDRDNTLLITAIQNCIHFMLSFKLSEEDQFNFFQQMKIEPKSNQGYREVKQSLSLLLQRFSLDFERVSDSLPSHILSLYKEREQACKVYLEELSTDLPITYFLPSFLHMHCNRFLGRDKALEDKTYAYLKNTLKNLCFKQKLL